MDGEGGLRAQEGGHIDRGEAAVAADTRGDALQEGEHARAGMAVDVAVRVDKPGADKAAPRVKQPRPFRAVRTGGRKTGDHAVNNQYIGGEAARPFRVDEPAAGNEKG